MKKIITLSLVVLLAGCATKNYGRQGELTDFEKNNLSCREIMLEQSKVHGFLDHIQKESQFDSRSVLSFLGDFGIGNVMEKDSAIQSANIRLRQLSDLAARKNCSSQNEADAGQSPVDKK